MEGLKVAKLVSGEFIIGRALNNGLLVNVFKINVVFDQMTGQPTMHIVPYMFPVNNNLDYFIGMDKVICMGDPGEKLQELYVQHITKFLQEQAQLEAQQKNLQEQNNEEEVNKAEEIMNETETSNQEGETNES